MKKYLFLTAAAAAMVLASCQPSGLEVEVSDASSDLVTITITASLDEATKATIDDGAKKWVWSEGDQLAVFDGVAKRTFDIASGAGTSVATFTGPIDPGAMALNAVFPYSAAGATYEDYTIPAVQTVTAAAVADPAAMVATATGEKDGGDFNFTFTSAVSFMRFTSNAAGRFIFHSVDKADKISGDGRAVAVVVPDAGTWWVAVKPATYTGLRVFRRVAEHDYLVKSDASLDLSTPGAARNLGDIVSTSTEVVAIETADELIAYLGSPARNAYICADLDLTAKEVTPCTSFSLVFDGQYHVISNWAASNALFATNAGTVQNIVVDKTCAINWTSTIPSAKGISFIVSNTHTGAVKNCDVAGNITVNTASAGKFYCAGVVGEATTGTVEGCTYSGAINVTLSGTSASVSSISGIVARFGKKPDTTGKVMVDNCENTGSITFVFSGASGNMKKFGVGGVVGQSVSVENATNDYGIVQNCINRGDLKWQYDAGGSGSYPALGGVAGIVEGQIKNCSNYGKITYTGSKTVAVTDASIGGVAGYVTLGADNCHNYGALAIDAAFAGGTAKAQNGGNTKYSTFGGVFGNAGPYATEYVNCAAQDKRVENCSNEADFSIKCYMVTSGGPVFPFGGVVGASTANVKDCENNGDVVFESQAATIIAGGIAGILSANMQDCTNNGSVTVNGASENHTAIDSSDPSKKIAEQVYLGGLFGICSTGSEISTVTNNGAITLTNCYCCGDPANTDYNILSYVGGINGSYKGGITLTGALNTATITNEADTPICLGGLSGAFNGTLTNGSNIAAVVNSSTWCSTVSGKEPEVGGVAGYANAVFTDCQNTGTVTNTPAGGYTGGFVGSHGEDAENVHAWVGNTVNCSIAGSATAAAVLGRFRYAPTDALTPTVIELGSGVKPFTVAGAVAALPLVGNVNGHTVTSVNVVVE